ncbi:RNA polymerase sigma factor for flagellar operon [Labilithrix luteola]|uniref:RNA polymerase sigma factor for flagellar operon n=1 Tax=Labilithrix luteola TaxID=1391654 RepID=A0A0K1PNQ5_9BACT|nr:FliA/WhiG family RNA polymerase sigma factor [Labilithrix luteola]AKU94724.1 RNA polymerase sigma factor for flagellar operon [Labilithrix luteola]
MSAARVLDTEKQAARVLTPADYRKYLPIVRRTAVRLARKVPSHISVADLTGYAWVGLVEAFSRAAPGMDEEEFEAYALYRIRGAMLDHLRSLDTQTRASRVTSRRVTRAIQRLTTKLSRAPEENEICEELGMSVEDYRNTLSALDGAGMSRLEMLDVDADIAADEAELPEDSASRRELQEVVAQAITKLPPRLQQVLSLYYTEECTLREIGEILEVSESRVSQLHTEAVHRLRAAIGKE